MEFLKELERKSILSIVIACSIACFIALCIMIQGIQGMFSQAINLLPHKTAPYATPGAVVLQIQKATDLTTAIYSAEIPIPAEEAFQVLGLPLGKTKLLYIAKGEIRAGIDLSQITVDNIDLEDGAIHIVLPGPTIIGRSLDVEHSTIYDIRQSTFGPGDKEALLQEAERQGLTAIQYSACAHGLLQDASAQAEAVVREILTKANYTDITIDVKAPAPNTCSVLPTA